MLFPSILSRMIQGHELAVGRIDSGNVRPFRKIAIDAGDRKILGVVVAAMLQRNDVIDLQANGEWS